MIACSCHAVSDRTIRAAAAAGLGLRDIVHSTGAGSDCGSCADFITRVIEEESGCSSPGNPCPGCPHSRKSQSS